LTIDKNVAKITFWTSLMVEPEAQQTAKALVQALLEATERADAASEAFEVVMSDIPSGLPHPDGTQRIKNASRDLRLALADRTIAHNRLSEFLGRGIGADDLTLDD
jgi:hypothetical protein